MERRPFGLSHTLSYPVILLGLFGPGIRIRGARIRWCRVSAKEPSRLGFSSRRMKGALHGHRRQSLNGHFKFMALCHTYRNAILRRPLTPADRTYIGSRHADEIAAPPWTPTKSQNAAGAARHCKGTDPEHKRALSWQRRQPLTLSVTPLQCSL
jgi:hypothetical protein